MYLFDTNVFLEILLDQAESSHCQRAIEGIDENNEGWISSFSLHAIEAIVGQNPRRHSILEKFLASLHEHPYFFCYTTTLEEELEVVRFIPKVKLDFDDALQYYIAHKRKFTLITLDQDFQKVKGIPVITPKEFPPKVIKNGKRPNHRLIKLF